MRNQNVIEIDAKCPQKKKLVTRMNGTTNRRSVSGGTDGFVTFLLFSSERGPDERILHPRTGVVP